MENGTTVSVGFAGPVKGRLPHGWRIEARLDPDTGILCMTSPDTHRFRVVVDTNKMDEYSSEHKRTSDRLDQDALVEAKYDAESGVLRFDSSDHPDFWLEVNVFNLDSDQPSKKRKTSAKKEETEKSGDSDDESGDSRDDERDELPMPWSNVRVKGAILTLWPGTPVHEKDLKDLHRFFKEHFDIKVTPVGCVTTLPDTDGSGEAIDGTGGRHDFFFFVKAGDVSKFAVKRFEFGMRWWSDVYFNDEQDIYPSGFLEAYPDEWHYDRLLQYHEGFDAQSLKEITEGSHGLLTPRRTD